METITKAIFLITIAVVMVLTLSSINMQQQSEQTTNNSYNDLQIDSLSTPMPSKRVSRFLVENNGRNPKAADHCNKDNEVCNLVGVYGNNATCCNNKCIDMSQDKKNCGACKNKCKFTEQCCGGECVNLSYDKRNCGSCGNKCMRGGYCIYGMCDYA